MAIIVGTNSYISEADAATYAELAGLPELTTAEQSLKQATIALDRLYGARFIGLKQTSDQALLWPRVPTGEHIDSHGNYRHFDEIPAEVEQATVELAVMIEEGADLYAQPDPVVTQESVEVDVIKTSRTFAGFGHSNTPFHKVNVILSPVLYRSGSIRLVR